MSPTLRASLHHLAIGIDSTAGAVIFEDWTARPRVPVTISLSDNAVLNLFLAPGDAGAARQASGLDAGVFDTAVGRLLEHGLLRSVADWDAHRARHPYVNLPSLWMPGQGAAESEAACASYEEAYARGAVPWNELPVAIETIALLPTAGARDARVLDLGCGSGHNLDGLRSLGFECWGIDISATAIARIRERSDHPDRFEVGSVLELPWSDASFSRALDVGCLHCLPPELRRSYAREVARVLTPGGRFLCRVFKPREERVVRAQPVPMESLGLDPTAFAETFEGILSFEIVKEGPVHLIGQASRPR